LAESITDFRVCFALQSRAFAGTQQAVSGPTREKVVQKKKRNPVRRGATQGRRVTNAQMRKEKKKKFKALAFGGAVGASVVGASVVGAFVVEDADDSDDTDESAAGPVGAGVGEGVSGGSVGFGFPGFGGAPGLGSKQQRRKRKLVYFLFFL